MSSSGRQGHGGMPQEPDAQALIDKALAGEPASVRGLVDRLSPIIARRVTATLWRVRSARRANVQQDAADLIQDVFLSLFQNDGKALRAWDPQRGMSLDGFVGLLAQHQVISLLRSGRISPWREDPLDAEEAAEIDSAAPTPEAVFSSREKLSALLERVRQTLSPRGLELFQRMFIDEEPIEQLVAATGMTRDALYQWRSRLQRTIRTLASQGDVSGVSDPGAPERIVNRMPPT